MNIKIRNFILYGYFELFLIPLEKVQKTVDHNKYGISPFLIVSKYICLNFFIFAEKV